MSNSIPTADSWYQEEKKTSLIRAQEYIDDHIDFAALPIAEYVEALSEEPFSSRRIDRVSFEEEGVAALVIRTTLPDGIHHTTGVYLSWERYFMDNDEWDAYINDVKHKRNTNGC